MRELHKNVVALKQNIGSNVMQAKKKIIYIIYMNKYCVMLWVFNIFFNIHKVMLMTWQSQINQEHKWKNTTQTTNNICCDITKEVILKHLYKKHETTVKSNKPKGSHEYSKNNGCLKILKRKKKTAIWKLWKIKWINLQSREEFK